MLAKLAKTDVIAIDDWGLAPLTDMQKQYLFGLPAKTVIGSLYGLKTVDILRNPRSRSSIVRAVQTNFFNERR